MPKCPASIQQLFSWANFRPDEKPPRNPSQVPAKQKKEFSRLVQTVPAALLESDELLCAFLAGRTAEKSNKRPGWIPKDQEFVEKWFVSWELNDRKRKSFNPLFVLYDLIRTCLAVRNDLHTVIEHTAESIAPLRKSGFTIYGTDRFPDITKDMNTVHLKPGFFPLHELLVRDGFYSLELGKVLSVVVGEKIDTKRIRCCEDCESFFWVERLDPRDQNRFCRTCTNLARQRIYSTIDKPKKLAERRKRYNFHNNNFDYCDGCGRRPKRCDCAKEKKK